MSYEPRSGNAAVPNDAPIQPAQAFVDNIVAFSTIPINGDPAIVLPFPSTVTHFDPTWFGEWVNVQMQVWNQVGGSGLLTANLSGTALDLASVNGIIAAYFAKIGSFTGNTGLLNISGGTAAAPVLPVFHVDLTNLVLPGGDVQFGFCGAAGNSNVFDFQPSIDFADSSVAWDGESSFIQIGIQDLTPTPAQVIAKAVALGGGKIVDSGSNVITISPTDHLLEPILFTDFDDVHLTGAITQGDNKIGSIIAAGMAVSVN